MKYLPIFMRMDGESALVVGGGQVAARKADLLIQAGAQVTCVALNLKQEMQRFVELKQVAWHAVASGEATIQWIQDFLAQAPQGHRPKLVIAATDDTPLNHWVSEHCKQLGIAVNVADQTSLCSFILPSMVSRGDVQVAVSTGGQSPTLARLLRSKLEQWLPQGLEGFAQRLGALRQQYNHQLPEARRKDFWHELLHSDFYDMGLDGDWDNAMALFQQMFEPFTHGDVSSKLVQGHVSLIGAGPGDPELLTIKALRLLQAADVVVYDRLVQPEVVNLARREAERIYVGKQLSAHTLPQAEINQLLVNLAKSGKRVVRLKGGDPFVFGRGGEELLALRQAKLSFTVVPGITSANGIASQLHMPLTHRGLARSVMFLTGHGMSGEVNYPWAQLADPALTLVIYMGLANLAHIASNLTAQGMDAHTPVAIIEKGTTKDQRVIVSDISTANETVKQHQVQSPALIVIGQVVSLINPSVIANRVSEPTHTKVIA